MSDINKVLGLERRTSIYGAPLGQSSYDDRTCKTRRLRLTKIRLTQGYAPCGTYWGTGEPLWCAYNTEDDKYAMGHGARMYVRGGTRRKAIENLREKYVGLSFYKDVRRLV